MEKFNRLDRGGVSPSVQWYNMYGAPEFADAGIVSAAVHAANGAFSREIDWVVSSIEHCDMCVCDMCMLCVCVSRVYSV